MPAEDCLFLNLWTPVADGRKRPVMFYCHGGGFTIGSGELRIRSLSGVKAKMDQPDTAIRRLRRYLCVVMISFSLSYCFALAAKPMSRSADGFPTGLQMIGPRPWHAYLLGAIGQSDSTTPDGTLAAAGRKAMAAGNFAEAQEDFEKLVEAEPSIAEAHGALGEICFKQRKFGQAVQEIQTALRLKPSLPRLTTLLGLSLAELGRYSEALPSLEKGFKQASEADSRRMCGLELLRAYTNLDRDADAVEIALALQKLYPNDPEVLYNTSRIYGNYAYIIMERLHDEAAGSIWMLQAQAEQYESQKNFDAAIVAFLHVLSIDPRRPGIHYRLGRIHQARFHDTQRAEENEAAMREFKAELAIDPINGNALYEIAILQEGRGEVEAAVRSFQTALSRRPDFEEALVGLAGVNLNRERPREAVPLLQRATRLRPDDEVAWYRLAQADGEVGNRKEQNQAMAEFMKLHNFTPAGLRRSDESSDITPQSLGSAPKQ